MRFLEIDENGIAIASYDADKPRPLPEGSRRRMVEVTTRPDVVGGFLYNEATDMFTAPPAPSKRLSKADVIGALTPTQWAEMNKFHPTADGAATSGVPYNDPEVFWAVSVFNAAERDFALDDPRIAQILGMLAAKGVIASRDVEALTVKLASVARP